MIDSGLLEAWRRQIERGERLHRADQGRLVLELIALQRSVEARDSELEKTNAQLVGEIHALRVQIGELNGTVSMLCNRGSKTVGTYEQGRPDAHGATRAWPTEVWGSIDGKECDWGGCDNPATIARFDKYGHGWLPCCESCAKIPV